MASFSLDEAVQPPKTFSLEEATDGPISVSNAPDLSPARRALQAQAPALSEQGMEPGTSFIAATRGGLPGILSDAVNAVQSKVIEPAAAFALNTMAKLGEGEAGIAPDKDDEFKAGQPIIPDEAVPLTKEKGVIPALTRTVQGLTTPGNLVMLPLAAASRLAQLGFVAGTTSQIPEQLQNLATANSADDLKDAATELGVSVAMAAAMQHGLKETPKAVPLARELDRAPLTPRPVGDDQPIKFALDEATPAAAVAPGKTFSLDEAVAPVQTPGLAAEPAAAAPVVSPALAEPQIAAMAEPESSTSFNPAQVPVAEIPVKDLKLSEEVPNFKANADPETGVVAGNELAGTYQRLGTAPIVAWKRLNGDMEVITGRHRFDLAQRSGEATIPAQVVEEAKGFTVDMAKTFDAEANIRDGEGSTEDYANYFRNSPQLNASAASARGLLSRAKGQAGFDLGKHASDDLYALWQRGKISDAQALAATRSAPDNPEAQQIGAKFALTGKSSDFISNVIKASLVETAGRPQALDLFGKDDSAMKAMVEQAGRATSFQKQIREQLSSVSGAAKKPEVAAKLGVNVNDPAALAAKVSDLQGELQRWNNWPMHPDLRDLVKGVKPDLQLAKPESVEEQKTRLAAEDTQRQAQAAREKLAQEAAKPLVGSVGDIGQKDIFGGGDLFSGDKNEIAGYGGGTRKRSQALTAPPQVAATAAPSVHPIVQFVSSQAAGVKSVIAPHALSADAASVGNAMRHFMGENALAMARADEALGKFRKEFDATPVPKNFKYDPAQPLPHNYAVIDAQERDPKSLPARYQDLAATFQKEFAGRIDTIQKYAPNALQHLIDNYFPHIWEDPKKASGVMAQVSSRLFAGRREFLKQRSLPFFRDGLERGLKPISDNPVDLLMAKMHSMDKFLLALKATEEMKASGAMKFKYLFERMPDGHQAIDDPSFIVQRPPVVTITEAFDQFQRAKLGEILKDIGVSYKRVASLGGDRWAEADRGMSEIRAKVGAAEDTLWHELGHHLDWKFPELRDALQFRGNSAVAQQLRAIADIRAGGKAVSASHQKYLRSTVEKMAEIFRTYVAAPARFKAIAPDVFTVVSKWLDTQPRLRDQLSELRQGNLVHDSETTEQRLGGMQVLGHWIMPDGPAQVLQNYLSPGLSRFGAFRAFKTASNILNAAQLGLSAFHIGFTSLDAATSRLAIGIEDLSRGKLAKATKTFASVPASPVTNILQGRKMMQEGLHPGTTDAETAQLVKSLEQGGGRIGQDKFWQTDFTRRLKRAWNEGTATGYLKSLPLAPLTAVEQALRPIMEYIVPRQKLGVFADMARRELDRLGPGASVEDTREAMRKAWDSVDNRMGQVVYDNLFYNRALKDLALMTFRAYGWQLGKYREGFGAVADAAAAGKQLVQGKRPEVSHRMAYAMALPIMVGTIGGMMNYLITGQRPQGWKDYFMPRTGAVDANGNASRMNLPSYMKDVLAYAKHPITSVGHSLNPMFSGMFDLLENKDFYGTQIRDPDDPLWKQGSDVGKFALKQFMPFSVSGAIQMHEQATPIQKEILPFFGITPVPPRMTMTPAQELAAEITAANLPAAPRTLEQFDRSKLMKQIVQEFRNNQNGAGRTLMAQGLQKSELNTANVQTIIDRLRYTPLQFQVHHLDAPAAMRVWRVANAQERQQLFPMIELKVAASQTLEADQKQQFLAELTRGRRIP